jgi:hypothetical protein
MPNGPVHRAVYRQRCRPGASIRRAAELSNHSGGRLRASVHDRQGGCAPASSPLLPNPARSSALAAYRRCIASKWRCSGDRAPAVSEPARRLHPRRLVAPPSRRCVAAAGVPARRAGRASRSARPRARGDAGRDQDQAAAIHSVARARCSRAGRCAFLALRFGEFVEQPTRQARLRGRLDPFGNGALLRLDAVTEVREQKQRGSSGVAGQVSVFFEAL